MPKPLKAYDVIRGAVKDGVSFARFRISKQDGERIREIERQHGRDQALAELLSVLRLKS